MFRPLARLLAVALVASGAPLLTAVPAGATPLPVCVYLVDHDQCDVPNAVGVPDPDVDSYPYIPPPQATIRGFADTAQKVVDGVTATVNQYVNPVLSNLHGPGLMCSDGGCGGANPSGPSFDRVFDKCVPFDDGHAHMYGCWTAWAEHYDSNPSFDWYVWEFHLSGKGTNGHHIYRVKARTEANDSGTVSHWSPDTNDQDYGNPTNVHAGFHLGADGFGFDFGADFTMYPGRLHSYVAGNLFHSSWEDRTGNGYTGSVEVGGGVEMKVGQGSGSSVNLLEEVWED